MLLIAISSEKTLRKKAIAHHAQLFDLAESLTLDDGQTTLADLESYIYPSLFSVTVPVVTALFLLDAHTTELDSALIGRLVASPTIFILEEYALTAAHKKVLQKSGAVIILEETKKTAPKKISPLFSAATVLCTSSDRKEKWLVLQKMLQEESPEALIGIVYWKLRDLMQKDPKKKEQYKKMYTLFMESHARAWAENISLALLLEKIVLQK